ncbi:hypothetical protein L6164_011829 [Bauhinia variegata]|uniref:Uncharacterized protein n=1 Tax=Bauhinia variegata TaxID=167791 RepID=A0ACB9P764_BAUVA|nr:hypothetical protein L6164_011829 [Bauhinia variegata]
MKILNWMQNKLNGNHGRKKPKSIISAANTNHMLQVACREEFSDWPQAIFAIGTFGNSNQKQNLGRTNIAKHDSLSSQDCAEELAAEEAKNLLQNELNSCFREEMESNLATGEEQGPNDKTNEHFNYKDSSLELERKENDPFSEGPDGNSSHFYPDSHLIPIRAKDLCLDNSKNAIGKESLSFLLKKMFVCSSGFQPTPSLKDSLSTESRIEKILRTILQKKIYPHGSNATMDVKKYLENIHIAKSANDEDGLNTAANKKGIKWVNTDSEYIVLEI